jgi:cytochrome b
LADRQSRLIVWDAPIRAFHWALVLCIGFSWLAAEYGWMQWHMRSGYAILSLLAFRLIWGFIGGQTARFRHFLKPPAAMARAAAADLAALRKPGPLAPHLGHNALGGLAVLGLLSLVALQAVSGLFTSDGIITDGPLVSLVSEESGKFLRSVHLQGFNALIGMIGLHIAAIIAYRWFKGLNLLKPMLTGVIETPASPCKVQPALASPWKAALALTGAIAAVMLLIQLG